MKFYFIAINQGFRVLFFLLLKMYQKKAFPNEGDRKINEGDRKMNEGVAISISFI
jgi:hypothetical protein